MQAGRYPGSWVTAATAVPLVCAHLRAGRTESTYPKPYSVVGASAFSAAANSNARNHYSAGANQDDAYMMILPVLKRNMF